jgi:hypothetical protein
MRALFVVVQAVLAEDRFEVRLVNNKHPVEAVGRQKCVGHQAVGKTYRGTDPPTSGTRLR